jgi:tumor protein p53-inducible protein 3
MRAPAAHGVHVALCVLMVLVGATSVDAQEERTMKAVVQDDLTGPLRISDSVAVPVAGPNEVLIQIMYTAVNRMDLVQAKGLYVVPPGASPILGVEVSGIVESIGQNCSLGLKEGDRVMALLEGGGYAQYAACDERMAMKLLPGMDFLTSSAIPESFMTAYQLLFVVAQMNRGESVLIHAAASSIGQAAIQLAALKGITVLATTRTPDKLATCLELGAHFGHVVGSDLSFASFVRNATNGKGVDVILDPVGSSYLRDNLDSVDHDARIVLYGLLSGGVISEEMNNNSPSGFFRKLLFKRVNLLSTTLRARSYEYKASLIQRLVEDRDAGFDAIAAHRIKVTISEVFTLEGVQEAHKLMAANKNVGKIIMSVSHGEDAGLFARGREEL